MEAERTKLVNLEEANRIEKTRSAMLVCFNNILSEFELTYKLQCTDVPFLIQNSEIVVLLFHV